MLGNEQERHYRREGYLVLEQFLEPSVLEPVLAAIDDTVCDLDPDAPRSVFKTTDRDAGRDERFFRSAETVEAFLEDDAVDERGALKHPFRESINKLGHALHDHISAIGAFARRKDLVQVLERLGVAAPRLWQSMVIFKQPRVGGAVRWHQDASYLYTKPASVVGIWVALEDATLGNGCLVVAPGAHRGPLRERYRVDWSTREGALETLNDTPWPDDGQAMALEVPAGTIVLFDDHLPHASAANTSDRSRIALTLHAAPNAAHWSGENWLQRPSLPPFMMN